MGNNQSNYKKVDSIKYDNKNTNNKELDIDIVIDKFVKALNIKKFTRYDKKIRSFSDLIFYVIDYHGLKTDYNGVPYNIFLQTYDKSYYNIFIVYDGFQEKIILEIYDDSLLYIFLPLLKIFGTVVENNNDNFLFRLNVNLSDEFKIKFKEACLRNEFRMQALQSVDIQGQKFIFENIE